MFELEEGTHYFNLGQPLNYRPATDWAKVKGTIPANPMTIRGFAGLTAVTT